MTTIINSDINSSTKAIKNKEFPQADPKGVLPISTTISLGNVEVGINKDITSCGVLPITICTAIVSPIARAMAKITAVKIPGKAAGKIT